MPRTSLLNKPFINNHQKIKTATEVLLHTYREWKKDGTLRIGAGIAYYGIIALVPLLLIAYSIAEVFFSSYEILNFIQEFVNGLFGDKVSALDLETLENSFPENGNTTLVNGLISIGSLIFAASLIFVALQDALNVIWKTQKGYKFSLMRYVVSFGVMLLTGATMTIVLAGHAVINFTSNILPDNIQLFSFFAGLVGVVFVYAITTTTVMLLHKSFIKIKLSLQDLLVSSLVIAALIYVGVYVLAIYLSNIADKSMYGSLSGLILVLIAIYYFAQIFLAGAQLSKVIAYRNGNSHLQKYLQETDPRKHENFS